MKKLMTILGVFSASIILTSCGGPEADAKTAECACEMFELMAKAMEDPTNEDLAKDAGRGKCEKIGKEMEDKYKDKDSRMLRNT